MLFNSFEFIIFFPIVLLIYFIIPKSVKNIWLLISSYYFYMCWNIKYSLILVFVTISTYFSAFAIDKFRVYKNKIIIPSIVLNLCILGYFKYYNFGIKILVKAFKYIGININCQALDIVLPVGISFYIFQAIGYVIDVYRENIAVEKNFVDYALFVSFFPQLVAGPIERSGNLIKQLKVSKNFEFESFRDGIFQMLWGFFLKLVIADKIALYVDTVYGKYETYGGLYLIVASMLFALQIYCDFAGYSTIAIGASKILGIELMENFNAPYLSTSVEQFWRKWHISLTTWFKDYLYIPLGGNRKGKIRKYINKIVVFSISGLWHGAGFSFVIWGALNGLYQVIGEVLRPLRRKVKNMLMLKENSFSDKLMKMLITFALVDFTWIFFRAATTRDAINIIISMFSINNPWILFDGHIYECGLNFPNFMVLLISLGILLFANICQHKGICIRKFIYKQDYWFRWMFIGISVLAILTFGAWGTNYDSVSFIYFQF